MVPLKTPRWLTDSPVLPTTRAMSYFKVPCPGCNKSLKVSEKLAGKSRACPYCRATVRIPETPPAEPESVFPNIQIVEKPAKGKRAGAAKDSSKEPAAAVSSHSNRPSNGATQIRRGGARSRPPRKLLATPSLRNEHA